MSFLGENSFPNDSNDQYQPLFPSNQAKNIISDEQYCGNHGLVKEQILNEQIQESSQDLEDLSTSFQKLYSILAELYLLIYQGDKKGPVEDLKKYNKPLRDFLDRKTNTDENKFTLLVWICLIYYHSSRYIEALSYSNEADKIVKRQENFKDFKSRIHRNDLRLFYNMRGDLLAMLNENQDPEIYKESEICLDIALELAGYEEKLVHFTKMNQALLYREMKKYEESQKTIKEVRDYRKTQGNKAGVSFCDLYFAELYIVQLKTSPSLAILSKAIKYIKRALKTMDSENPNRGRCFCLRGFCYLQGGKEGKAKRYYRKGLRHLDQRLSKGNFYSTKFHNEMIKLFGNYCETMDQEISISFGITNEEVDLFDSKFSLADQTLKEKDSNLGDNKILNISLSTIYEVEKPKSSEAFKLLNENIEGSERGYIRKAVENVEAKEEWLETKISDISQENEPKDFLLQKCSLCLQAAEIYLRGFKYDKADKWFQDAKIFSKIYENDIYTEEKAKFFRDLYLMEAEITCGDEARESLTKSIAINKKYFKGDEKFVCYTHLIKGRLEYYQRNYTQAEKCLREACKSNQEDKRFQLLARNELVEFYLYRNQLKQAKIWQKSALKYFIEKDVFYYQDVWKRNQAKILYKEKKIDEARMLYREALDSLVLLLPKGNKLCENYVDEYAKLF